MSGPIDVGVVGVGHLGRHHARLYAAHPDARLVGVADTDSERAAAIAASNECAAFANASELVGKVQAVSVAVPTEHHRAVAEPLLAAGIDVLIEKPIAATLEDADAILETAARAGRRVMVGHTERFNPAFLALDRVVDSPKFFEIHRLAGFTARSTDIDVVLDLMIHDIDLILHLDGTAPLDVHAVGVSALTDKVDIANARVRFESGCVANLTASRISAEPVRRIRIFQARTYLSCDTGKLRVKRDRLVVDGSGRPTIEHDVLPVDESEPLGNEIAAFLDTVRQDRPIVVDGVQGRNALQLALRIREAIAAAAATP